MKPENYEDEEVSLSQLLGGLPPPAAPPTVLLSRLQVLRPQPPKKAHWWTRPLAIAASVAVLGAAAALLRQERSVRPAPPLPVATALVEVVEPIISQEHLLSVRPLGVIQDSADRTVRLMECTWLDLQTFGSDDRPTLCSSALRREIVPVVLPIQ